MFERDGYGSQRKLNDTYVDDESALEETSRSSRSRELEIYHVRRVVAGNPNTPKQVLARLSTDTMPNIRRRVAENPKTPVDVLMILAHDDQADVRLGVAENPNTPSEVLSILALDEDVDVRFGVAENPHMPEEILVRLSEDDNPYIRCRALKTLQILAPDVQSRLKLMMQPGYGQSTRRIY